MRHEITMYLANHRVQQRSVIMLVGVFAADSVGSGWYRHITQRLAAGRFLAISAGNPLAADPDRSGLLTQGCCFAAACRCRRPSLWQGH